MWVEAAMKNGVRRGQSSDVFRGRAGVSLATRTLGWRRRRREGARERRKERNSTAWLATAGRKERVVNNLEKMENKRARSDTTRRSKVRKLAGRAGLAQHVPPPGLRVEIFRSLIRPIEAYVRIVQQCCA